MKLNRKSLLMLALLVSCVSSHYGCGSSKATRSESLKQYYWDVGLFSGDTIKAAKLVRLTGGFLDLSVGRGEARSIALDSITGLRQNMSIAGRNLTLPVVGLAGATLLGVALIAQSEDEESVGQKFSNLFVGMLFLGGAVIAAVIVGVTSAISPDSPPEVYDLREMSHNEKYYIISQILDS
jgi:hypothetical protein